MSKSPLRTCLIFLGVALGLYVAAYAKLQQRVYIQPKYSATKDPQAKLTPLPVLRGQRNPTVNKMVYAFFRPLMKLDVNLVRPEYWKPLTEEERRNAAPR